MDKFTQVKSIPAYLPIVNVDTDMMIPKQFLKTIKRTGLGKSLFFELRYDEQGNPLKEFVLNQDPYNQSKVLIREKILVVDHQENMLHGHCLILVLKLLLLHHLLIFFIITVLRTEFYPSF